MTQDFVRRLALVGAIGLCAPALRADVAGESFQAARDNSMWEESGSLSNGAGTHLFSGMTSQGSARRALVYFDIQGSWTVTGAQLLLWCSQSPPNPTPQTFSLHRVTADWGEAGSDAGEPGGLGDTAETGDATWTQRFFAQAMPWTTPGGDFDPVASATAIVGSCPAPVFFESPQLAADAQAFMDDPSTNFGWILIGNEGAPTTARRFESREAAGLRPELILEYYKPPIVTPAMSGRGLLATVLIVLASSALLLLRRRRA